MKRATIALLIVTIALASCAWLASHKIRVEGIDGLVEKISARHDTLVKEYAPPDEQAGFLEETNALKIHLAADDYVSVDKVDELIHRICTRHDAMVEAHPPMLDGKIDTAKKAMWLRSTAILIKTVEAAR